MVSRSLRIVRSLTGVLLFTAAALADHHEARAGQPQKPGAGAPANLVAREVLAQFAKGDPGWQARMEGLIRLVKAGPSVTGALTEALTRGSPSAREFAAQALVLFADAAARPALEQALK